MTTMGFNVGPTGEIINEAGWSPLVISISFAVISPHEFKITSDFNIHLDNVKDGFVSKKTVTVDS